MSANFRLRPSRRAIALEPRLLFDGAGAVAGADALVDDPGESHVEHVPQTQNDEQDNALLNLFETMSDTDPTMATVGLSGDTTEPLIGEDVTLKVVFDNEGSEVGYGPFIELFIERKGVDGSTTDLDLYDGLEFKTAEYLGVSVTHEIYTLVDGEAGAGQLSVSGETFTHPVTGKVVDIPAGFGAGDQLIILTLPFGSFTPDQPAAEIDVVLNVNNKADPGHALKVVSRGGYMFGKDALDNPSADPVFMGEAVELSITPQAFTVTAELHAPEGETVTGPNFVREIEVTITPAAGTELSGQTVFEFAMPDGVIFVEEDLKAEGWEIDTRPTYDGSTENDVLVLIRTNGQPLTSASVISIPFYVTEVLQTGNNVISEDGDSVDIDFSNAITVKDVAWRGVEGSNLDGTRDTLEVEAVSPAGVMLTARSVQVIKDTVYRVDGESKTPTSTVVPGDVLEYEVQVDISDFFRTGNVIVTDTLPDGLTFDKSYPPTLQVNWKDANGVGQTSNVVFDLENVEVKDGDDWVTLASLDCGELPTDLDTGETKVRFLLSQQLSNGGSEQLLGGLVDHASDATIGDQNNWEIGKAGSGGTTATIAFRAKVEENYRTERPLTGQKIDHQNLKERDVLESQATVTVEILDRKADDNNKHTTLADQDDDSSEAVSLPGGEVGLVIASITRDGETLSDPENQILAPGDVVTYRLEYTLPIGDYENLKFDAYLPMPAFELATGTMEQAGDGSSPVSGQWSFGPGTTATVDQTTVEVHENNHISFVLGDSGKVPSGEQKIEIYFAATVTDSPFTDRLLLTTQGQHEDSSSSGVTGSTSAISQIVLGQADVHIHKGYTGLDTQSGKVDHDKFTPGEGITSDTINQIGASNAHNLDGGDTVQVTIAVENRGSSARGAYDVQVRDSLDETLGDARDIVIYNGNGDKLTSVEIWNPDDDGKWVVVNVAEHPEDVLAALHGDTGIRFVDVDGKASLARGAADDGTVTADGSNIIYISYKATVKAETPVSSTGDSEASLVGFANAEGATNFLTTPREDNATITYRDNDMGLVITKTDGHDDTDPSEAVIGEYIEYKLTINLAEAKTTNGVITVDLGKGLGLVDVAGFHEANTTIEVQLEGFDAEGSSINGKDVKGKDSVEVTLNTVSANQFTIKLGDVINADNDDGDETITVTFRAIPLNTSDNTDNDTGASQRVTATFTSKDPGASPITEDVDITIREPQLETTITADKTTVSADETVTYTLTVTNTSSFAAHDVVIEEYLIDYLYDLAIQDPEVSNGTAPIDGSDAEISKLKFNIETLKAGGEFTVTFTAKVAADTPFSESLKVEPTVTWTSLPGDVVNRSELVDGTETDSERTGGEGDVNNYIDSDGATVTFAAPKPVLVIDATSEPTTEGPNDPNSTEDDREVADVTIGEIVRLRMVVELPESESSDVSIVPILPDGLSYVGDATIALVSHTGITSSALDEHGSKVDLQHVGDKTLVNPTHQINLNEDTGRFELGNLNNRDRDPDNAEYIVIEFNVLVKNESKVTSDDALQVTYRMDADGYEGPESNPITLNVVEPTLNLDKSITHVEYADANPDTNSKVTVTYTVTLTNDGDTTAHDIALTDLLPDGATVEGDFSTPVTDGDVGSITNNSGDSNHPNYVIESMASGSSVTITYTVTLPDRLSLPEATSATATWTSLAGETQTLGSTTTGAAGTSTGERTGDGDDPDSPNNYRVDDPAEFGTISGKAWDDTWHQDNVQGDNEVGLRDVLVQLQRKSIEGGWENWLTTHTDADGKYEFGALPAGEYRIVVPSTVTATIDGDQDNLTPRWDTDDSTPAGTISVNIVEGETQTDQNFTYLRENDKPKLTVGGEESGIEIQATEDPNDSGDTFVPPVQLLNDVWVFDRDLGVDPDEITQNPDAIFGAGSITVTLVDARENDVLQLAADGISGYDENSVTYVFDETTKTGTFTIELTETTTLAQVKTILEAIQYAHNGDDPTDRLPGDSERTSINFTVTLNDGNNSRGDNKDSGTGGPLEADVTGKINLVAVNDPPVAADDTNETVRTDTNDPSGNVITGQHTSGMGDTKTEGTDHDPDTPESDLRLTTIKVTTPEGEDGSLVFGGPYEDDDTKLVLKGKYGDLYIDTKGNYEYVVDQNNPAVYGLDSGDSLVEEFEYTLTDGETPDTELPTATLTITIHGDGIDPPSISPVDHTSHIDGDNIVYEAGLRPETEIDDDTGDAFATGKINVEAPGGIKSVEIGGEIIEMDALNDASDTSPITIYSDTSEDGSVWKLEIIGFAPGELEAETPEPDSAPRVGEITYRFTLLQPIENDEGADHHDEDISLTVTDQADQHTDGTLTIRIIDDEPEAVADEKTVDNDTDIATGNALDNDTLGADRGVFVTDITGPNDAKGVADGDGITIEGEHGTLVIQPEGEFTYTRHNGEPLSATEVFTYTITDADGDTSEATITIHIDDAGPQVTGGSGTPPVEELVDPDDPTGDKRWVIKPDGSVNESGLPDGSTSGDNSQITTGTINFDKGDGDGDEHTVTITGKDGSPVELTGTSDQEIETPYGTVTITDFDPENGTIEYTYELKHPSQGDNTTDEFEVTIEDKDGDTTSVTVVIDIINDDPVANPDTSELTFGDEDTVSGNVFDNDNIGADGEPDDGPVTGITQGSTGAPTDGVNQPVNGLYGTITIDSNGNYTYEPDPDNNVLNNLPGGETVEDVFTYTITDSDGDTSTATLTITIHGNTPPVAEPDTLRIPEDSVGTGNVLDNDGDDDGDKLKVTGFTIDGIPGDQTPGVPVDIPGVGAITIDEDGNYTFTPIKDWNGEVPVITYTVTDGKGERGTTTSTLTIIVEPVPDAFDDEVSTESGMPITFDPTGNDTFSNPDKKITEVTHGNNGTVTITSDGRITYTPNPGFEGTDTFTYTVTSGGITETATVTVNVRGQHIDVPPPAFGDYTPPSMTPEVTGSPLTRSVVRDTSVFFQDEAFDRVDRMQLPFHPIAYVNRQVQVAQDERMATDVRFFSNPSMAQPGEVQSRSIGAGLGADPNLFVQHAVRDTQTRADFLARVIDGRLGRIGLSSDGILPTPDLFQADPGRLVPGATPAPETEPARQDDGLPQEDAGPQDGAPGNADAAPDTNNAGAGQGDTAAALSRLDESADQPDMAADQIQASLIGRGAPSFTEQLKGGSARLPATLFTPHRDV